MGELREQTQNQKENTLLSNPDFNTHGFETKGVSDWKKFLVKVLEDENKRLEESGASEEDKDALREYSAMEAEAIYSQKVLEDRLGITEQDLRMLNELENTQRANIIPEKERIRLLELRPKVKEIFEELNQIFRTSRMSDKKHSS